MRTIVSSVLALVASLSAVACATDPVADEPATAAPSSPPPPSATAPCPGGGEPAPGPAAPAVTLGRVVDRGACSHRTDLTDAKCYALAVEGCPGVPAIDVELLVAEPKGPAKGTIVFGSGGGGGAYYEDAGDGGGAAGPMLERLHQKGYRVVERAWAGPPQSGQWFEGTAGPAASACRYATLATFVKETFHKGQGGFCATGNSGGSVEIATALTRQGRGEIFDYALLTSGPAASFDKHCGADPSWPAACGALLDGAGAAWECGPGAKPVCDFDPGIKQLVDSSWRPGKACQEASAANASTLVAGSPIAPGATTRFDKTTIELFFGLGDCKNGVVPAGLAFAKSIQTKGAPPKVTFLSQVGHSIHAVDKGAAAIESALEASCR